MNERRNSDMNFKAYVLKTFRVEGLVEMAQPALFTDFGLTSVIYNLLASVASNDLKYSEANPSPITRLLFTCACAVVKLSPI